MSGLDDCAAPSTWSPAMRRYQLRFWPLMGVYVLLIIGVALLIKHGPPLGSWRYVLAAAPALPLIGVFAVFGLYLGEVEEFRRWVIVQSMLWAIGVVLSLSTVWGFLELLAGAPHLELWWIFPIYSVTQGLAQVLVSRRYR
jgi:hypothetical protein